MFSGIAGRCLTAALQMALWQVGLRLRWRAMARAVNSRLGRRRARVAVPLPKDPSLPRAATVRGARRGTGCRCLLVFAPRMNCVQEPKAVMGASDDDVDPTRASLGMAVTRAV